MLGSNVLKDGTKAPRIASWRRKVPKTQVGICFQDKMYELCLQEDDVAWRASFIGSKTAKTHEENVSGTTRDAPLENQHLSSGHKIPVSFHSFYWLGFREFPYCCGVTPNRLGSIIPELIINQPSIIRYISTNIPILLMVKFL